MQEPERIYLDNAATAFPKPDAVHEAVENYSRHLGAAMGRGAYREAREVQDLVDLARARVANLLGAEDPSRIVWTLNGTDSLNLAIHGLLRTGDHVVTSVMEHNSVLRPLRALEDRIGLEVTRVGCDGSGRIDPAEIEAALRRNTQLVVLAHASNVTGTIQPIEEVGRIARDRGVLFLLDSAQTAGHLPIDLSRLPVDLLACPGHKGLLGPLGTGVLYLRPGIEERIGTLREGGTGSSSEDDRHPGFLPDKYESGNHNVPGIVGVGAGAAFLLDQGLNKLRCHEQALTERLLEGFEEIPHVRTYGPREVADRMGVVSLWVEGYAPHEFAGILDDQFRIQVRSGLHCAPLAHRALGTLEQGGTVRFSVGPFNTPQQIEVTLRAVREIAEAVLSV